MIIKIAPDAKRAASISKMAAMRLKFLKTIDTEIFPTIAIETYYEIIKEISSGLILMNGLKTSGEYAHKELFQKILELGFITQEEYVIIDDLRIKRNNSSYDGVEANKNSLDKKSTIEELINKLQRKVNVELLKK